MSEEHLPTLQQAALKSADPEEVVKFMSTVWKTPIRQQYWPTFKSGLSNEEMSRLAKVLPWDDPVARDLDFTVHKRRMSGKIFFPFFTTSTCGVIDFPYLLQTFIEPMGELPFCFPFSTITVGRSVPLLNLNGGHVIDTCSLFCF